MDPHVPDMPHHTKEVFLALRRMTREVGHPPTIRELLDELSWLYSSTSNVKYQLDNLVILGYVKRIDRKSRNYIVIDNPEDNIVRDPKGVIDIARKIAFEGMTNLDTVLELRRELSKLGVDYQRTVRT